MLETGRVVLKIAGREAGKYAVIVNKIDDNFVFCWFYVINITLSSLNACY